MTHSSQAKEEIRSKWCVMIGNVTIRRKGPEESTKRSRYIYLDFSRLKSEKLFMKRRFVQLFQFKQLHLSFHIFQYYSGIQILNEVLK